MSNLLSPTIETKQRLAGGQVEGRAKILVIDDEVGVVKTLKAQLEAVGHEVVSHLGGLEGLEAARKNKFDLALVDMVMPGIDGPRTLEALKEIDPSLEVLMITGYATMDTVISAVRQGACDFLLKPISLAQLKSAISRALVKRARRTNAAISTRNHGDSSVDKPPIDEASPSSLLGSDEEGRPEPTNPKVAERSRAEKQARLQTAALESAANAIAITDRTGCVIWVNPAFTRLTGYSSAEIVGQNPRLLKSGTHDRAFYQNLWKTIASGKAWSGEMVNRKKDGSLYQEEMTITPVQDSDGKVSHYIAIKQDVTERKRAEAALQESEERYHILFSQMLVGFSLLEVINDENGNVVDLRCLETNSAFEKHTGLSREAAVGKTFFEILPGIEVFWIETLGKVATTGESLHLEAYVQALERWFEVAAFRLSSKRVAMTFADISERKKAEKIVEERTAYLNTLFEISPSGIVVLDVQGRIQMSNSTFERVFGYSRAEILGRVLDDLIVPQELAREAKMFMDLCLTGPGAYFTTFRSRKDRTLVDVDVNGVPLIIEGKLCGLLALYQDISERKRAESEMLKYSEDLEVAKSAQEDHARELARLVEELAQERDLLGTLMDNIPDFIFYKDRDCRLLRTNLAHAKALGLAAPHEAVGKSDFDFFPEDEARVSVQSERQIIESGQPVIGRIERLPQPGGDSRWLLTSKVPIRDTHGRVIGLVGISRDTTEQIRAEETLRASEESYRELFENASDIVYTSDLELRLTSLNRVGQEILGYSGEEATRLNLRQIIAPRHWEIVEHGRKRILGGEQDITLEVEVAAKDGSAKMLEVKPRLILRGSTPVGVQGIARDITGRDAVEMELRQAQKLESVGRMASGIAHEINTPIQFVGDNTRFLQDSFGGLQSLLIQYKELHNAAASGAVSPELLARVQKAEGESDCEYLLEEIPKALTQTLDGVSRVATIVHAMKEFAHPESREMAAADLNRALQSTLTVARNELKYVADVETEFGELPLVICNVGDLNQVFLNLLVNAAHAISAATEGKGEKRKDFCPDFAGGRLRLDHHLRFRLWNSGSQLGQGFRSLLHHQGSGPRHRAGTGDCPHRGRGPAQRQHHV